MLALLLVSSRAALAGAMSHLDSIGEHLAECILCCMQPVAVCRACTSCCCYKPRCSSMQLLVCPARQTSSTKLPHHHLKSDVENQASTAGHIHPKQGWAMPYAAGYFTVHHGSSFHPDNNV